MIRNLKALGLALVAVFALSVVAASAASANEFHSSAENTSLNGVTEGEQIFEYEEGGSAVVCTSGTFSGEILGKKSTKEVTIHPVYNNCTVPSVFNAEAHVRTTGCNYIFTINAAANNGPVHVECGSGSQIEIEVTVPILSDCVFHIGAQTPGGVADYANAGTSPTRRVTVNSTQTGIDATRTGNSLCGAASSSTGQYFGGGSVSGKDIETGNTADVFVE